MFYAMYEALLEAIGAVLEGKSWRGVLLSMLAVLTTILLLYLILGPA